MHIADRHSLVSHACATTSPKLLTRRRRREPLFVGYSGGGYACRSVGSDDSEANSAPRNPIEAKNQDLRATIKSIVTKWRPGASQNASIESSGGVGRFDSEHIHKIAQVYISVWRRRESTKARRLALTSLLKA